MIVVDASVAVKWFLLEDGDDAARGWLEQQDHRLHGPDLLLTEVTGAIVRSVNARSLSRGRGKDVIHIWTAGWAAGRIEAHRLTAELISRASAIALDLGHPLKDCIYLALSLDLGCALLTADAKFRDRAVSRYPAVALLCSPPS